MPTRDELATAWDEGYAAAEYMAKCWGHVDSWEDEPSNPYRAAEPGVAVPEPDQQIVDTEYPCGCRAGWSPLGAFAVRCDNHAGQYARPTSPRGRPTMSERRTDPMSSGGISVSVHGLGASIDAAVQAGQATVEILKAIGNEMGEHVEWEVTAVYFKCDGCGLRRPDRPAVEEGWTYRVGHDLCPSCSAPAGVGENQEAPEVREPS